MPQYAATVDGSPLAPHECRIWWATTADGGAHLESLLSAQERERWQGYLQVADRRRFLTGAALLRRAAAACLSTSADGLRVDRTCHRCGAQHGKPRLPDQPELDVSVAHTGEYVAVALACGPRVGIDVERLRDVDVDELARSAFAPDEAAELAALPAGERVAAFYRMWTLKESIVKALGVGITDDFAAATAQATGAAVHELSCAPGYVAALAVLGRCDRISELDARPLLRSRA